MLEPTPVGHFSKLGAQTIQNVTSNDSEYLKFLKYFGRVFKHPVSVALEFYSNRPDAQFIASKGQWERADYHVTFGAKGINFLDQKGTLITLYDFEDVIEEIPPKRWSVTQNNVSAIRSQLHLAAEQPLFMELESSVTSPMDDLSIIQDLGLAALPDTDKLKFRDSYHNMIQVMLTGRLEVNGARYRIQPDRAALGYCQTVEQKFYLLTAAASAARKALTSLEYAFDTLRTQNELIRKEAKENEIRRMAEAESGRKAESVGNGLSAATAGGTSQRDNISESGDEGRTDRLVSDTGSRNAETGEMVSGDNNGNSDVGDRNDRTAVSSESTGRTLHSDDTVRRTDTGGRTDRDIREDVDGKHGEELPGESRNDDVLSQVSGSSEVGGQESGGILRSAERTVRQEQSTSSEQLRSNDNLGDNEEIRNRTSGNDGNSSRSDNDNLNVDTNINAEIAEKWDNLDVIVDNENGSIDWVYYNPDSLAGGQLVINHIYDKQFQEAARFESSYDFLISSADQELVDITSSDFSSSANHYLDVANSGKAAFVSRTSDTKVIEQYLQNYGKKLQQNNNKYAEYRASLRNTVYTRLNDTQRFNFSHCKYVEEPKNSIWGEIDNAVRINNGIFQVTTASHGGIMIKSEIAKTVLSREAQKIAQKDNGWHFYEEDCAYAAAMREIVDKDLFSDINSYFSRQYNKKPDEFLSQYNDVINTSLQRWFKSYWDKRETALFNTLSPEEQAVETGQLSFAANSDVDTNINEEAAPVRTDLQALFSVEINGEQSFYKVDNKTADDILRIAKYDEPYLTLNDIGYKISETEYAEIQQSAVFTYSVDINLDDKSAVVYSVNDDKGGISEGDRTDSNTSVTTVRLADYRPPYHGLAAQKIPVSAKYAISMWDNSFPVYFNNEIVPKRTELSEGTDVTELFSDDKVFSAEFGDVKKQQLIDAVSSDISEIDAVMPEERYIDIRDFVEYDENNVFEWDNGQNIYLNVTKALIDRNFGFIEDYLTAVKNEFDSFRGETAQNRLVEYANYAPPEKDCDTVLDLPEYGLSIDLKEIDELYMKDEYSYYEGGIDSDGHERKDNYSRHNRSLTISLDPYGVIYANSYDDRDLYDPYREKEYDVSDSNEVKALREQVIEFIKSSEDLSITSYNEGNTQNFQIREPDSVITDDSILSTGPIVDGVEVYKALADEIDRGTGFVNGKIRVQEFYEKSRSFPNHPTVNELAECLKKEYGTGGHSGEGNITMVDYDRKGMTFSFQNGEKFRHTWYNVAALAEYRLRENIYLSPEQQEQWQNIKAGRSQNQNYEPYKIKIGDQFRQKATKMISEVVSLTETTPYYKGEYTIKRLQGASEITENVAYNDLVSDLYEYVGNAEAIKAEQQQENTGTFEIYQLKSGSELRYHRFTDYETLHKEGNTVDFDNYELKYTDELHDGTTLEDIYTRFNTARPEDFTGHSLSVSDVIVIHDGDDAAAYYIDDVGYKKVPEFLQAEQKPDIVEKFRNKTALSFKPINNMSAADIENMVKDYIEAIFEENNFEAKVGRTVLYGSRSRGIENDTSDIDIVAEVESTQREDTLFNVLHETEREIGGYVVDINPIRKEQTGTLEDYLIAADKYLSEKAANIDTPDYEQAIHEGFTALYANHTYTDKQKKFLERLERFAANNNVTENIVSTAFENGAAFRNTYANKEYVSRNLFARRLGSTEKELESNIRAAISPQELETKVHQVITNAGSDGGIDDKMEYASFAEAVEVGQKYIEDGYLGFAVYNQNTQMIERVEGDFPITQAFNDTILRINGINEQSDKGGLVIVQVGSFWELYGEDARKAADVLGIALMQKGHQDMCGFPDHVKDEYCKKLSDEGYTIINGTNIEHFDTFTKAKQLINDFCEKEYKIEADFRDMHSVSIAYTTLLDDEFAVQVTADLIDLKIIYEFNNEIFNTEQYDSIEDMVENGLTGLNFDELVSVPDEVIEKYLPNIKDYSETYTILSRCKQDCTYTINRAEHIDSMTSLNKYLYGGSVDTCINTMRELYDKLPDTDKPEWLSLEDINDYERQLNEISANIAENPVDTNINAEATAVATSSNDVEQLTDELNAQTLSDVEVGDILLLKEPESGEMMYFRIDSMQDNFMVSMSRVADDVGNDFTEIGLATKGIIDGHWKETLLDENTDSPILRFTKSYQEELRNTNTDNTIINIPEYGISIDLKEVDFLYLRDDYSSRDYGGYVDSNVNISLDHNGFEELKILLTKDGFINSEEYISAFGDESGKNITGGKVSEFTINKVNAKVSHFIRNAEKLEIYTQRDNVKQNIQIKEATVDTNINEAPVEERVHKRASRAEMLYREFTEAYPDMANGTHTYERYGDEYDEYGENDAFEPLSLEYLGDDTYSFMTWYVLNGDLMRDPDFVFSLDHENKELHVWEFQMDGVPSFGTLYERVELDDGSIDRQLQASLEDNFRTNLRNAIAVKRELTVYKDINGEEHNLKPDETEVKPEKIEINDSSAYYRETLNAFSEKHSLGELNLKNADNGFHITEKFKDGISVPMWFIAHREPTLLTISELEKELELIEKQAERNKTDVSEMNFRQRTVKEHAGMTELPMVQDDLPEINLVSDPREKISNNNIALIELERLRIAEANGIYPFSTNRNDYNSIDNSLARLRGYSGWGGVPQLFDETFSNLKYWRDAIKSRLTPEEYANARRTTLTSHYTPQVIIDAMYKTIRNMGLPKNSRILEPSCGTGNFIARMPHDMGKGGIVGVEIDSVTADIAKYLNVPIEVPNATEKDEILRDKRDIRIINSGFERSGLENNSFDLAIGNVPFGEFKLNDPDYTDDWYIHDAFFRKALDKVAPGGIVAFVTSTGTLDKKNPKIREYLATRADLVGAVRLPNNAFADAGTSTSTDIVFLQKRKELLKVHDPKPDWCYTLPVEVEMVGKKYEGEKRTAYINSYFVQNPQMVLGTIKQTTHFDMLTCEPIEGKNLKDQLDTAFRQLNAKISIDKREQSVLEKKGYVEPWGKSFTYQIKDDKVFFNSGNAMEEVVTKGKNFEKYKALCELRDTTRELLEKQVTTSIDYDLTPLRNKLNEQYDNFVKEYGNTTSKSIVKLFRKDADYPILAALESVDPDTKAVTKADIFTRRTVNPIKEITEVDTIEEAMQVSLDKKGKIDIGYMSWLLQHKYGDMDIPSVSEIVAAELLEKELVFKDPAKIATGKPYAAIVDRSEYLCGDVRRKLIEAEQAAEEDNSYAKNVEALKEIIPEDIGATEISVDLGCTWIDTEDYEAFIRSLSGRSENDPKDSSVQFSNVTGQFKVGSSRSRTSEIFNTNEISTYGTEDMNMYRIIENLLNQRKVQVFDYIPDPQKEGKLKSVINSYKTKIAQSKAKEIKKAFSEWIFATDERKEKYVKRYNERFNSIVGRSYDGSHLTFTGLANKFELRKHQLNCIARSIYGGNTLAAHCVGAGKSAVIAASVMKKKELGLIHKACVVVPKPLTEQTEREWRMSFPDAKLFVLDNKDLSDESKRELFTARVATGDYDAVIMSQEQFEKLAMSPEYQADYLDKKISEMRNDLEQRKRETGRRDPSIKELEVVIIKTERQIENIMNPKTKSRGKDNLLSFETLGFDYLVADEAHAYKNGYVSTKMGDVQGVNTNESGRSGDMLMKCDYFNNEFGNGHILFATGTPVSNSMSELYVMTRYLRPDLLENCGCSRFDDWVATFGMIKTQNKKTATGELKLKTCFAGFKNRPELMKMYKEFADLVALDKLLADPNSKIVVPKIKGGKPQVIEIEATPEQREIVKDFARRGRDIQSGKVRPDEDNLLKITGEARLVGLGNKAVAAVWLKNEGVLPDGFLEDDKSGKIDECVKQTAQRYFDKYDDKAVQIIFSDIAVNSDEGKFSAYEYIRAELIAKGVKADEIIFAPKSDAKNRSEVFRDINEAKYRIVIGSTGTIGTGANIQKHLYALHHLDIPWRPSDFEQREGRIVRQGNLNSEVEILNYVTKGTLDSYLYQGVTDKARGIAQLWNDSNISRTSEDIDEKVLTFGELEAAAEGNPKLREYSELKNKIDEMQIVRADYNRETTRIERSLKEIPDKLAAKKKLVEGATKDLERIKAMRINDKLEFIEIKTHTGQVTSDRAKANKYIADKVSKKINSPFDENPAFYIKGFKVSFATTDDQGHPAFAIQGERSAAYRIECGVGENSDNYQRLLNFFDKGVERQIEKDNAAIDKLNLDYKQSQERVKAPFPGEDEYNNTLKAFEELEHELTAGGYLDSGEELTGADDYNDYETEKLDTNVNDTDDMDISEYNSI